MKFEDAPDINVKMKEIVSRLEYIHIDTDRIVCFRSSGSKSMAQARIYAMPKVWQKALGIKPHYVIEVLSENFDCLEEEEQWKTVLHELLHIPKNFSGALLSHKTVQFDGKGGHKTMRINRSTVEKFWKRMKD